MIRKKLVINGVARDLVLDGSETLAKLLRERLLLTGCKIGCGEGHCGACNVIVDGKVTRSCVTKVTRLKDNAEITTIEGIGTLHDMHPLQVAWMANGCAQCGFCAPGFIMSGIALLNGNCSPTRKEVRDWFDKNRNLCRCAGYKPMIDQGGPGIQAGGRQHKGHKVHTPLRRTEGHGKLGFRRGRRAEAARGHAAARPDPG